MGICNLEWVCRSFILVTPIGKSNTPLMQMYSCFFGFEKVPVCVLVSSKSRGPPCGGSTHGVLLRSHLGCWVLVASSGKNIWAVLHRSQCSFKSMNFRLFLAILLVTTPWAVVLSVCIGV